MNPPDRRELATGLLLMSTGAFVALYAAKHYTVGVPASMGPGFFPVLLGTVLAVLGLLVLLLAWRPQAHVLQPPPFAARPFLAVLAAILVFSLLVERLGLVPATLAQTLVAVLAERPFRLRRSLLLAAALALVSWLIFSVGLKMSLPAFTFLG